MWKEIEGYGVRLEPYEIQPYTKKQAKKLGVKVEPSLIPSKKIDIYQDGKLLASVGARGMKDYPTYIKERGLEYAEKRRALYKIRHKKDKDIVGSRGWFADQLLW
jgi:hypothetical protein